MYRCDSCGNSSEPREVLKKIIKNKRLTEYCTFILRHKRNGNKIIVHHKPSQEELKIFRQDNFDISSEKYSKGWEIVSESKLCQKCYDKVENESNNSR